MNINKPPTAVTAQIKERKKKKKEKKTRRVLGKQKIFRLYTSYAIISDLVLLNTKKKKKEKKEQQV